MRANFDTCLAFTLHAEGGFSDNPADPGGATNKGITLAELRNFTHQPSLTVDDLRGISDTLVRQVYQQGYWDAVQCDQLPAGADLIVFDMAVNAGDHGSASILQGILGVTVDGLVGPETLAAARPWEPTVLINGLSTAQLAYYRNLKGWVTFGHGWTNRLEARTALARQMAVHVPALTPQPGNLAALFAQIEALLAQLKKELT